MIEKKFGRMVLIYKFNDEITQLKMLKLLFDLWNKKLDNNFLKKYSNLEEILRNLLQISQD